MHQDIEDSLAASSMSHAGGPQSPARSAENLLNGHRSKGLMELGRREDTTLRDSAQVPSASSSSSVGGGSHICCVGPCFCWLWDRQGPHSVILRRKPPSITNRLTSRKSAPVLNQIFEEEGESDDDFEQDEGLPPKLSRLKMNMGGTAGGLSAAAASSSPSSTQKRYHRRKSQGRGSSCSSSETSDDDSESHRRRLDKDSGFSYSWNRRDSSEGPPGSSGGTGGGSSSGQGGGASGPDRGSPPAGGGGGGGGDEGGGGSGGGGGGNKGQDSPSSCCCNNNNSSSPTPSSLARPSRAASRGGELVESLKLLSLCLRGRGGQLSIDPGSLSGGSVKIQEKSAWRMCISSTAHPTTAPAPAPAPALPRTHASHPQRRTAAPTPHRARDAPSSLRALKSSMLQLPLCEKISVNIQGGGGGRDGLLCSVAPASCCHVI
ncbi:hypothetical protein FQN60_017373 [Etheostoma spectabile]|uniref:Uncharacterized protein n=1 Tax=Etheostoma spectabile TaxID=54343 RepID=A0A5J5DFI9_9PERO|nr:hypothetical protein FQN60_017373 [Etheostoma spectabile]